MQRVKTCRCMREQTNCRYVTKIHCLKSYSLNYISRNCISWQSASCCYLSLFLITGRWSKFFTIKSNHKIIFQNVMQICKPNRPIVLTPKFWRGRDFPDWIQSPFTFFNLSHVATWLHHICYGHKDDNSQ